MLDDFAIRAALAGLAVAIAAGPLGCFVVWRRMAYFGDATAHAALLGVALALAFSGSVFAGVLAASLAMALAISTLSGRGLALDTLLGVLAHTGLAAGLVIASLIPGLRIDLSAWLFGDILAVSSTDVATIWIGAFVVLGLIATQWSALLTSTLNPDLAQSNGIDPRRGQLVLTLTLALVVAVAIKLVGALLITAMLIIPAAAARPVAKTPESMAVAATVMGTLSVVIGLWISFRIDTPTGPTIVCAAASLFVVSSLFRVLSGNSHE